MEKNNTPCVTMSSDKIAEIIQRAEENRRRAEKAQRKTWAAIQKLESSNPELYQDLRKAYYRQTLAKNKG